uniref:Uncharacterized protein n=1 Tax=mine drainage metagenome TaxID=410659 RepID=E6PW65_9ZZZZ
MNRVTAYAALILRSLSGYFPAVNVEHILNALGCFA